MIVLVSLAKAANSKIIIEGVRKFLKKIKDTDDEKS
jgi:hypothetical protein